MLSVKMGYFSRYFKKLSHQLDIRVTSNSNSYQKIILESRLGNGCKCFMNTCLIQAQIQESSFWFSILLHFEPLFYFHLSYFAIEKGHNGS